MQPYSPELKEKILNDPDFMEALKINHLERFISLGAIVTSYSPLKPEDEIIGFYTYDLKLNKFKQDFIVNVKKQDKEFILYTRFPSKNNKSIRDINEFYKIYSQGKHYINSHHLSFNDLPDEIKPRAQKAIDLANKIKLYGLEKPTDKKLEKIIPELQKIGL